jgi:hypothetical protein
MLRRRFLEVERISQGCGLRGNIKHNGGASSLFVARAHDLLARGANHEGHAGIPPVAQRQMNYVPAFHVTSHAAARCAAHTMAAPALARPIPDQIGVFAVLFVVGKVAAEARLPVVALAVARPSRGHADLGYEKNVRFSGSKEVCDLGFIQLETIDQRIRIPAANRTDVYRRSCCCI